MRPFSSARNVRRTISATVFIAVSAVTSLLTNPAYALSAGCEAINARWGGGETFSPAGDGTRTMFNDGTSYSGFADGEELVFTVSATGTPEPVFGNDPFANSGPAGWFLTSDPGGDLFIHSMTTANQSWGTVVQPVVADQTYYPVFMSGNDNSSLNVKVVCRETPPKEPDAPTIGNATAGNGQATVAFTAPASDGGSAITGYTVTSSPGGLTGTGTASPITVMSLANGTSYTFTVTAANAVGTSTASAVSNAVTPVAPPMAGSFIVPPVSYGSSGNNIALNTNVTNSPTSYAVGSATTAQGGTVSVVAATGAVTYTAPTGYRGNDTFVYTATNASGTSSPATVTVPVGNPIIAVTPATLTAGTGSTPYSQMLTASGGKAPYTFSTTLASGVLPTGLTLSSSGTVSGTPRASGTFTFTVTGTDASTGTGPATFTSSTLSLTIAAPTISVTPTTLNTFAVGTAYTAQSFAANGGNGSYTFDISSGSLPAGMTLTAGGLLSGTPSAAGAYSFTIRATDGNGFTGTKTYGGTVNAAVPSAPAIGSATAGNGEATVSFSAPASDGGATITGYTVTSSPGGFTNTGSQSPISITGLANGVSYTFTVTATNSVGTGAASGVSNAVTPASALPAPVANAVSATVAANSPANPVTLEITGGTAASVTVASPASHGTATASGTTITYTPDPGYSGTDSFTYTATNATGTSAPATVTITVTAPTLALAPAAGALPAGTVGTVYGGSTIVASLGTAPYTYAVTNGTPPAGVSLYSNGTISGTPSADGTYSITVTATDANGATGTVTYSLVIGVAAPVANPVAVSVAANSSANTIPLDITGGTPTAVAVDSAASHGTATANGTTITYTPAAGYSGTDSFSYTATNATGTSAAATVTVTVTAPTLAFAPATGTLTAGTAGIAYGTTIVASGGTGPYTYTFTGALPAGLSLDGDGTISGTPSENGNYSINVTATDAYGATGTAEYSLSVNAAATFVFSPAGGALGEAMAGEEYSQPISATGGTGALTYSVIPSNGLPQGMVLNISTGELTGPLDANTEGDYSFSIQVEESGTGTTASAAYTLKVKTREITVADQVVNVAAGSSPPDVYLNHEATGGPFTDADIVFVEPANAGTAAIIQGQVAQSGPSPTPVGWYLQFTPNPAYSGQAKVGFRLTSALGLSNTGTVTFNLNHAAGQVATEVDQLVHGFVQSRQNMISSTIEIPGLLERRRMSQETDPVTAKLMPSDQGLTVGFSTSLAQIESAGRASNERSTAYGSPFNIWIDGAFLAHRNKDDDEDAQWGSFAMINIGADYLLSDKALVGISLHYDRMTDPADADAELTGNGWLAGPYASLEIGKNVFWNTSLLYGGSANDIDTEFWNGTFDTTRWMADTSIEGQWTIDDDTVLTPKLRAVYFSETVEDYAIDDGAGSTIDIDGFDEEQFRLSLGLEIARSFTLESGSTLTPKLGLTTGFSGLDGAGGFASLTAGLSLQTVDEWSLAASILLNMEGDDDRSLGGRVGAARQF